MALLNAVLQEALNLKPAEQAELVDKLLSNLEKPDREIEEAWAREAEDRLDAYERGELKAISLETVLEKYK